MSASSVIPWQMLLGDLVPTVLRAGDRQSMTVFRGVGKPVHVALAESSSPRDTLRPTGPCQELRPLGSRNGSRGGSTCSN